MSVLPGRNAVSMLVRSAELFLGVTRCPKSAYRSPSAGGNSSRRAAPPQQRQRPLGPLQPRQSLRAQSPDRPEDAVVLERQRHLPGDGASNIADRVAAMSGGRLTIDFLPSGAVVQAFQVQDACHDGVLDCAHTVTAYWYGKDKAASLVRHRAGVRRQRVADPGLDPLRRRQGHVSRAGAGHAAASTWSASSPCRCRPSRSAGSRSRSPKPARCRA